MRDVAVIGVGLGKCGELWEGSLRSLFVNAALEAIDDAGVDRIDSMYIGCMSSGLFNGQEHLTSLMSDYLGTAPVSVARVESACASGGVAFRQGYIDVASGMSDIVLVGGVEKMTDVSGGEATYALASASDREYEAFVGITFPGLYAMIARAHMQKFGTTSEQLAHVAVKNHNHATKNPKAQYPMKITVDTVLNSVMVADPLHILDCSPITDGAAACILCSLDQAKKLTKKEPIKILGSGSATDSIALHDRKDLTGIPAARKAAQIAYKQADLNPKDIHFGEVHDCFTIAEICIIEELGFIEKGKGGTAAESGLTAHGGKIPINLSGGLKAKGHPVGATGVAMVVEVVQQLRGELKERMVDNAIVGLTHNMGGTGGSNVVHIFGKI
jgi:acetyl-CoA C-acetyltransferase